MPIVKTFSATLTDAEFLLINGAAAPTIPQTSPLFGTFAEATSAAGTTTITLPVGQRRGANINRISRILSRAVGIYPGVTQTY